MITPVSNLFIMINPEIKTPTLTKGDCFTTEKEDMVGEAVNPLKR
jgi:hypothetical protein